MNRKMIRNTDEVAIGKFLTNNKFTVPPYQRSYTWKEEAIEFFEDIIKASEKETEYFIGPMVLSEESENKYIVIDGQQRLVSVSIMLAAMRDLCIHFDIRAPYQPERNYGDKIDEKYLKKEIHPYTPPDYSVKPNRIDEELFNKIIDIKSSILEKEKTIKEKLKEKRYESWKNMWNAYKTIYNLLKDKIEKRKSDKEREAIITNLLKTLDEKIKIVLIDVESEDDAYLVFETLNARGLKLAPVDLIKNYLFSLLKDEKLIEKYDIIWSSFLSNVSERELTMIIRYYLIYKYEFLREKELFRKIKTYVTDKERSMSFIQMIEQFINHYLRIINPSRVYWRYEEIVDWLEDLHILRITQHIPILFALIEKYGENTRDIMKKLRPLYIMLIRRSICRKLPSEVERQLENICKSVKENDFSTYREIIKKLNPGNEEVKENLVGYEFRTTKERHFAKVLLRIFNNSYTRETRTNRDLTLEHIFPESRKSNLSNPSLVYKIGNLTLLLENQNIDAGNEDFSYKRSYYEASKLPINQELVHNYSFWNEECIIKRTSELSEQIARALSI